MPSRWSPTIVGAPRLGRYQLFGNLFPRIVMTSITPFGQDGPYAAMAGSELIVSALGGVLTLCGDPDRRR
ncbi:CoA transferase [Variovorax sp. LjRoot84]|jgi:benzylsuccinate CoA-transferase BbsE subunit|uniref:CoA transferase n=1 Tax=Variovorax sp. LjRoot84 TaxID=3342340 RepID=UPI003F519CC4